MRKWSEKRLKGLCFAQVLFFRLNLALLLAPIGGPSAQAQEAQFDTLDPVVAEILVRDILVAVNQANLTGNYTVLRDIASPNFSVVNDPSKLASIFEPLRAQQLDLRPVLAVPVVIEKNVILRANNQLQLAGYFPTLPRHIRFEMIFEPVSKHWRLLGVGVASAEPAGLAAPSDRQEISDAKGGEPEGAPLSQERKPVYGMAVVPIPKKRPTASMN